MHHAWTIAWRPARCCVQSSRTTTDLLGLRQAFSLLARPQQRTHLSRDALRRGRNNGLQAKQKQFQDSIRHFSTSVPFRFQRASHLRQQTPHRAPSELSFQRNDLRPYEVKVVFGSNGPPPALANTLLKVLHACRVNGTLDLELPTKLRKQLKGYPGAVDDALAWLRHEHPLDEDAAILRRIEREEAGQGNEELIARAENLGFYKPQSGTFGAKLGDEGDIFGESELQKIRKENELKAEMEQKELDEFIEQKQQATEERGAQEMKTTLEARKEDGLEVSRGSRPPNSYEKWKMRHHLGGTSKITLEEAKKTSKLRRLLPSVLFAAAVTYASYLFALTWTPPDRANRLMPSQPFSSATILGIIGINTFILLAWRFPPAWSILNRYFVLVPAVVRPFSSLGNVFSHYATRHLCFNMLLLWLVGNPLHEQIGRGDFLAIYIASGVLSSIASLSVSVFRNLWITSSMGASGAVIGVFAAFCTINPDARISFWLLPSGWQERFSCDASTLLVLIVALEVLSMTVPFLNRRTTDHVAHLGGYAVGIVAGWLWRRHHGGTSSAVKRGWGGNRSGEPRWFEKLLGR